MERRTAPHASRPLRGALLALLGLLACGCLGPRPGPEEWQAIGFRTPEQTFQTFQTAFASGQLDLEYRCLSEAFRAEQGVDSYTYRILRERLAEEVPGFSFLSRARIQGRVELGEARVGLVARVRVLWIERWLLVELVREDFYELYRDGERLTDGYASLGEETFQHDDRWPTPRVWAYVELDDPLATPDLGLPADASGLTPIELSELVVGQEWKLYEVLPLTPEAAAKLLDPGTEPEPGASRPDL